jgi:uncharacterized Zn-finger protein
MVTCSKCNKTANKPRKWLTTEVNGAEIHICPTCINFFSSANREEKHRRKPLKIENPDAMNVTIYGTHSVEVKHPRVFLPPIEELSNAPRVDIRVTVFSKGYLNSVKETNNFPDVATALEFIIRHYVRLKAELELLFKEREALSYSDDEEDELDIGDLTLEQLVEVVKELGITDTEKMDKRQLINLILTESMR